MFCSPAASQLPFELWLNPPCLGRFRYETEPLRSGEMKRRTSTTPRLTEELAAPVPLLSLR